MYSFPLINSVGYHLHRSDYSFLSFVVLGSMVVHNITFVFILSSRSVSGGFSMVDCVPFLIVGRCPIVVFIDF